MALQMKDLATTRNLISALGAVRGHHPDMTLSTLCVFLYIASEEGITQRKLEGYLGYSNAAISRNVSLLGCVSFRRNGKMVDTLGLIEVYPDPLQRNYNAFRLTKKGEALLHTITTLIGGHNVDPKEGEEMASSTPS